MKPIVLLDSGPLGLVTQRRNKSDEADACRLWLEALLTQGVRVIAPEIADYEVRRELLRAGKKAGVARLNLLRAQARFLPIDSDAMLLAAELWAQARNAGYATASPHALDGDVILGAQVLTLGLPPGEFVVATSNVAHISRYCPADEWTNITP